MTLDLKEHGGHHRRNHVELEQDEQTHNQNNHSNEVSICCFSFWSHMFRFIASNLPSFSRFSREVISEVATVSGNPVVKTASGVAIVVSKAGENLAQIAADEVSLALERKEREGDTNPEITKIGDTLEEISYAATHGLEAPVIARTLERIVDEEVAKAVADQAARITQNVAEELITDGENLAIEAKEFIKEDIDPVVENIEKDVEMIAEEIKEGEEEVEEFLGIINVQKDNTGQNPQPSLLTRIIDNIENFAEAWLEGTPYDEDDLTGSVRSADEQLHHEHGEHTNLYRLEDRPPTPHPESSIYLAGLLAALTITSQHAGHK